MKRIKGNIIAALCVIAAVLAIGTASAYADSYDVAMKIDGRPVTFDESWGRPYISGGRTMVPVRIVMESFGCNVEWNGRERSVEITRGSGGNVVKLFVGSNTVLINGNEDYTDTQPVIVNNRTYLPIRFVLEAFGAGVVWSGTDRTIYVYSEGLSRQATYTWRYPSSGWRAKSYEIQLSLDNELYTACIAQKREPIYEEEAYLEYVLDGRDDEAVRQLVDLFNGFAVDYGLEDDDIVRLMVAFVQSFKYIEDTDWTGGAYEEYPKYPYETLYDHSGDCEDTAMLLYAMLRQNGYGCCLIALEDHMAVGVLGEDINGSYYEHEGERYYYIETTAQGWDIGEIPREYSNLPADLLFDWN